MRIPERYDQLEDDGGDTILPIHTSADLAEVHNDDGTLTIELVAIENNIGHSGNEIDTTGIKNTIDTVADVITHQVPLEAIKWMRIPERYDQLEGNGGYTTLPIHKNTDLLEAHKDDSTLTIELWEIENNIGHSGNKIDMTDKKNTIDTQTCVITHYVIRFASSDNADVHALSSSLFEYVIVPGLSLFECLITDHCDVRVMVETRKLCNSVEGDSQCHHEFFWGG